MFKDILNNIQKKLESKKIEMNNYNNLVDTTTIFKNLFPIPSTNQEITDQKLSYIQNNCPDINKEKATIIAKIIPISETYLEVYYTKEVLTNKEYYLIPTNNYLWVINQTTYGAFHYKDLNIQIIKNNIMSKIILLNNILLEINGNDNKINTLTNIISNEEYRNNVIKEKNNYLCNITPIYQSINSIGSGISIDKEKNIVFHKKEENLKTNINNLENYELLVDNQSILSKTSYSSNKMTSFSSSCYSISIKITTKDNKIFIIPILEPNTFGSKYNNHDTIYQENFNFAKNIIEKLKSIQENQT